MTHDEITTRRNKRRAHRGRADYCWGRGRRLVVVDVENIAGGPCKTEDCVRWVRQRLMDIGAVRAGDVVVVGVDGCGQTSVGWGWPGARVVVGHGPDGADRALLEELADRVPQRFDSVVLASGDGIFADAVASLIAQHVAVTVVAHEVGTNSKLRAATKDVLFLSRGGALSA